MVALTDQFKHALGGLVGEELAGVYFVRDYIQLSFDGRPLTLVMEPEVRIGDRTIDFPRPGSREMLCELINSTVTDVTIVDEVSVIFVFDCGGQICISLKDEDQGGPDWEPIEWN